MKKIKLATVVGARPQFVKSAVFSRELRNMTHAPITETIIHTGQHYDPKLSSLFFKELDMPEPQHMLAVGSAAPAVQVSQLIEKLGKVLTDEKPDGVLLYGDTNSTLAAAIVSTQLDIPVIHVEAGERIFRRKQVPEEANRVIADTVSALCLTSTQRATKYLRREGFARQRVKFVGDLMYDLFEWAKPQLGELAHVTPDKLGLTKDAYILATIHRAENTDSKEVLLSLLSNLDQCGIPVVLPTHPRVQKLLNSWKWSPSGQLKLIEPVGYFDLLSLLINCKSCFTDSGGVTREAFFSHKPCIIPMENSWWTEIVESGWAMETGLNSDKIQWALHHFKASTPWPENLFGDGRSAKKIIQEINNFIDLKNEEHAWHRHGTFKDIPKTQNTDFTYFNYQNAIKSFKDHGYTFASFDEAPKLLKQGTPFVLMRHDVDMDLEKALNLAEIENKCGISSTYFFLLRTDHYNVFSQSGTETVNKIIFLGHKLGLHFDCAAYKTNANVTELAEYCRAEVKILEYWFNTKIEIVSYHRPNALVLSGDPQLSAPLPHSYMPLYNHEIQYFSDSRGEWKRGAPWQSEIIEQKKPLHILVHPIWWNEIPQSPYETLSTLVDRKFDDLESSIAANCVVYNVGELKEENHAKNKR